MTLEESILVFKAAAEELQRHSTIGFSLIGSDRPIEIQLYEHSKIMELPGDLVVEERSGYYPFQSSKIFAGIKLCCLYKTDPRIQEKGVLKVE